MSNNQLKSRYSSIWDEYEYAPTHRIDNIEECLDEGLKRGSLMIGVDKYNNNIHMNLTMAGPEYDVPYVTNLSPCSNYIQKNGEYMWANIIDCDRQLSLNDVESFLFKTIKMLNIIKILKIPNYQNGVAKKQMRYIKEPINTNNIKDIARNIHQDTLTATNTYGLNNIRYLFFNNMTPYKDLLTVELINQTRKTEHLLINRELLGIRFITSFSTHPRIEMPLIKPHLNDNDNSWTTAHDILKRQYWACSVKGVNPSYNTNRKNYVELIQNLCNIYSNPYAISLHLKKAKNNSSIFANKYDIIPLRDLLKKYKAKEMLYFYLTDSIYMNEILAFLDTIEGNIVEIIDEDNRINQHIGVVDHTSTNCNMSKDALLDILSVEYGYTEKKLNV